MGLDTLDRSAGTHRVSLSGVASTRQVIAGTGLVGGGDLSVDRTFTADFGAASGKVTQGNDSRLSDVRHPIMTVTEVKTAKYTAAIGECVRCDTTLGIITVTLPSAAGTSGQSIIVKEIAAIPLLLTIATSNSELIDGLSTATISAARGALTFTSTGTGWIIT